LFQFGGEKSPSKASHFKYRFSAQLTLGEVKDEQVYLIEKNENSFPSDVTTNSVEDNINILLNN
jgi:hypothetical protein